MVRIAANASIIPAPQDCLRYTRGMGVLSNGQALQVRDILSTRGLTLYKVLDSPLESLGVLRGFTSLTICITTWRALFRSPRSTRCWP